MRKSITTIILVCAVTLGLALSGCSGGGGSQVSPAASNSATPTVSGVASLDTTAGGSVSVKDSSVPAQEKTTAIVSDGSYVVNVNGLKAPFILKAQGTDQAGNSQTLYSISTTGGRANINPISDTAVAASTTASDGSALYAMQASEDEYRRSTSNFNSVINSLRTILAPLFALYNVSGNGVSDDNEDDNNGLSAMLHDVRFVISSRTVTVTNRHTGGVIFSGPLNNLASGTFHPENMPAGPGGSTACTSFTYSAWGACQSNNTQTRTVATSSPSGCTGGSPVLSQSCTYVPPPPSACTYNYSNWGACQSNNTQTRTVTSSSPAGCTGTPVLSQACTYVPPVTACTSFTYSAWGACQSNSTQTRTVATSLPSGCTGGSPVLSQACTYVPPVTTCTSFTYSAWGACQSNSTQTRTVATSLPSGCTGGSPVLSQACTYVPPVTACTSFTYSAWGACQSNSTQTRTVATSLPSGCTGGSPVLSQACTYTPPSTITNAQVTASCTGCHGLTSNTTVFKSGGYSVSGRTAAAWLTTVNKMVGYGSSLPAGATAQDLANFLASVP